MAHADDETENERYLLHKLKARRHLAADANLIAGYNLYVVAYAVISVLSRIGAADAGRERCSKADQIRAIQAADLLVLEHPTLRQGGAFGNVLKTLLANRRLCASMLARLGV